MAEIDWQPLIAAAINILISAIFINWAARIVADRGGFGRSILVAIIGNVLAVFAFILGSTYEPWLGYLLAILVWAAVAAAFFRTRLLKGAVIGLVAVVLFFIVSWLIDLIIAEFG
jgi:hypothetical protein